MENSKIEWTDHTFNPWIGCQKVSPGCDHCYAEFLMDHRYGRVKWGPHGERKRTSEANWKLPRRWAKHTSGHRPRVFCASLADWLDNKVPREWRSDLGHLIEDTPSSTGCCSLSARKIMRSWRRGALTRSRPTSGWG